MILYSNGAEYYSLSNSAYTKEQTNQIKYNTSQLLKAREKSLAAELLDKIPFEIKTA